MQSNPPLRSPFMVFEIHVYFLALFNLQNSNTVLVVCAWQRQFEQSVASAHFPAYVNHLHYTCQQLERLEYLFLSGRSQHGGRDHLRISCSIKRTAVHLGMRVFESKVLNYQVVEN